MNKKNLLMPLALLMTSCAIQQQTAYQPADAAAPWKIEVVRSAGSATDYALLIDGAVVAGGGFPWFGSRFEATGQYRDRPVRMDGHRVPVSVFTDSGTTGDFLHQIRVSVDGSEITHFIF